MEISSSCEPIANNYINYKPFIIGPLEFAYNTNIHTPVEILHRSVQIPMLDIRRELHLRNFMFKMKTNNKYLHNRDIRTRLHDAPVFILVKPNCEKYKGNVFFSGATSWNYLPAHTRNIETYERFKFEQKKWALRQT